jgi:hypothetical protein
MSREWKTRTQRTQAVIAYRIGDGTSGFTGDPVARDRLEGERWWPHYRREVWAYAWRSVARLYD